MAIIKKDNQTENQKRLGKCIADITGAIAESANEREKNKSFFTGQIKALQQEINEQTARRNDAASRNDTAGFREAAKAIAAAEIEKKQYEESMAAVQNNPGIAPAQAATFMHELQSVQESISKTATDEIRELVQQIIDVDNEAMRLQNDLIMTAQGLSDQARSVKNGGAEITCNNSRVFTIIGPTNNFPWRAMAEEVKKRAGMLGIS